MAEDFLTVQNEAMAALYRGKSGKKDSCAICAALAKVEGRS
jgi:hypothetical protein